MTYSYSLEWPVCGVCVCVCVCVYMVCACMYPHILLLACLLVYRCALRIDLCVLYNEWFAIAKLPY